MPFQMKIQPIDSLTPEQPPTRFEPTIKPIIVKSRLKRLFDLQFLRNSTAPPEKVVVAGVDEPHSNSKDNNVSSASSALEFEPSSVCLDKMVQNFIEENEKQSTSGTVKCSRNRCNCFNGNCHDSSEDEFESSFGDSSNVVSSGEAIEILKSLVPCASVLERNLLADTAKIVDKNKICKRKDDFSRKIVIDGLVNLGYNASICKSRWEKSPSHPAGEYEYIDVITSTERLIIDIDFRSEFEIARSTKAYKFLLQALPYIFVGKCDRLRKILSIVSDAAKQSLKKKGMHIPPWRKADYVLAKWLSPHIRAIPVEDQPSNNDSGPSQDNKINSLVEEEEDADDNRDEPGAGDSMFTLSSSDEENLTTSVKEWKPPEIKPNKSFQIGAKIVTGLASVIEDEP